ncbi:type II secretion system major pseudopilin GspG [Benzoatithermus flavus]|uniref:Type II secretion system core protein G n=1 Tax=Benzoatithermus flavus TaxID=3108223 RepID=A0ABU8XQ99_9PROT
MSNDTKRKPVAGRRREAGFTLIELLVVLVILGLLAALAGPRVIGYLGGAKSDTARLQVENFKSALDLYRLDTGSYPTTQQGLAALVRNPGNVPGWKGPYIDSPQLPTDPWGNAYVYRMPGEHGAYDLYSLGADKAPGGTGEAADVTSWGR